MHLCYCHSSLVQPWPSLQNRTRTKPFVYSHSHSHNPRSTKWWYKSRVSSLAQGGQVVSMEVQEEELKSQTLMSYFSGQVELEDDLVLLISSLQSACKHIASLLAAPSTAVSSAAKKSEKEVVPDSGRDIAKPMDIISILRASRFVIVGIRAVLDNKKHQTNRQVGAEVKNEILKLALQNSGKVAVMASEEEDGPVWFNDSGPYVVIFDPLDGSRNIDASIPTGTIFGIYRRLESADYLPVQEKAELNVLQKGEKLLAAGYVLYSSATVLCIAVETGSHLFTLDRYIGEFILTCPNVMIPQRGQIYSVNDARYFDWSEGLRQYIDNVRQGKGQNPKKYSARYICSLVADFHRTVLYGGIAMNPRDHLRLVYEANPLSFISEKAGGKGSNGKQRILDIQPFRLHQRLPLFLGSKEDVSELESYENVQQLVNPGYEV